MRADMAKVIVDRPRHKGWAWSKPKGYQRRLRRYGDDPVAREGIKARWRNGTKALNEHLGPLRRYLDSQVGRPWDKVFSEICAHIDRSSTVQDHVRDHVAGYVTVHVLWIGGVPCCGEGGWLYGRPLHECRRGYWYVCPHTGLLRRVRAPKQRPGPRRKDTPKYVRVSDTLQCRYLDGAWHLVTLKPLPEGPYHQGCPRGRDVLLERPAAELSPADARRRYGAAVYAVAVRRLGRRELRQYPIPAEFWS